MITLRKKSRVLVLLVLASFMMNCIGYKRVTVPKDQHVAIDGKTIFVHGTNFTFYLTDVTVKDHHLIGSAHSAMRPPLKSEQVHIYTASDVSMPDSLPASMSIPIRSINKVEVYDTDIEKTLLKSVGVPVAVTGALILIILATKESCPFIYVYNGAEFDFTGEIYAGAIHPPLERHDYLPLPTIQPVDNEYRIKMTNEVHEIQYTNLAELIVINHPANAEALIDKYGTPHTLTHLQAPTRAVNLQDTSIYEYIANIDSLNYMGDLTCQNENPTDGVILDFERPQTADTGKLVIRAKNSFWLDYIYGQFYNLFGDAYDDYYDMQKTASKERLEQWKLNQGIPLSVYIEKNGAWEFIDYFHIVGPLAAKKDVLALDLREIQTDGIRIKLESGFLFWEIDYVAMDFSDDIPVQRQVVPIASAVDQDGQDVSALLLKDDAHYQTLAHIGDQVLLSYPAPEKSPNSSRSVFLHSKGHYQVLRDPHGTPDLAGLYAFRKPGRFLEFSKQRFLEIYQMAGYEQER